MRHWFFAPKNQYFGNKSGKTLSIRTKFSICELVKWWLLHGSLGAIDPFWAKWGLGRVPRSTSFFCVVIHATFRQLRNGRFLPYLSAKHSSVSRRWIRKDIFKNFHFRGYLPQKTWNRKSIKQPPHSEWAIGHGMHCRKILFTPRCRPRAREFPKSVNFSLGRTVAELQGVKFSQFSDFGQFSPYKTPKTYLPVTSVQPKGYIAEWFRFFHVIAEGPKGCLLEPEISSTSGRGAGDP